MKTIHPALQWLPAALAAVLVLAVGSCAAPPQPTVVVTPPPSPAPLPRPLPTPPKDWRDAPATPGTWGWAMQGGRSTASFGPAGGAVLASLSCDKAGRQVLLARTGQGTEHMAMAVTTSTGTRPLVSEPVLSQPGWQVTSLNPRDPILDAIAFSRGRFALEAAGAPTLYLPSWPELSRVIEDCR